VVNNSALNIEGVTDVHYLHLWASGTSETAATAHIVVNESISTKQISALTKEIKHAWNHLVYNTFDN